MNELINPPALKKGDKVALISSARGTIGEKWAQHEVELGIKRFESLGIIPVFMENSRKGVQYLAEHPQARADDFRQAFFDTSVSAVFTAIGGVDSYKVIPYLLQDNDLMVKIKQNPKIFLGYGDATVNHLFFYKMGIVTYYGPNFLCDFAEFGDGMLDYTAKYIRKLFSCENIMEIEQSDVWYKDRRDFSISQLGVNRLPQKEKYERRVLCGNYVRRGKLLGGGLESLYEAYVGMRFPEEKKILAKTGILPEKQEWEEKIFFFDTCEHAYSPEIIEQMLVDLDKYICYSKLNGILIGKPMDEIYFLEYENVYKKVFKKYDVPVMYNINFGYSAPRCFLPYGCECYVDFDNKKVMIIENPLRK